MAKTVVGQSADALIGADPGHLAGGSLSADIGDRGHHRTGYGNSVRVMGVNETGGPARKSVQESLL